jgi:riboflavin synthase
MFTGIIEEVGRVKSVRPGQVTIAATQVLEGTKLGDSMAVNGACLTVTALNANSFSIEVMPETLRRTNLGLLHFEDKVNLERALALGGHLGGHLVQGHVDATGKVISLIPQDGAIIARYAAPPQVMRYVVEKSFIAVDGVSLTVVDCNTTSFTVSLVAYTLQHTILGEKHPGDLINLEVDIMAKYVERLQGKDSSGITLDLLAQHGFL